MIKVTKDLKDIPEEVKIDLEIVAVSRVEEILKYGLV